MGLLGEMFDDIVEIVATPAKLGAALTDEVLDTDLYGTVDEIKESVKTDPYGMKKERERQLEKARRRRQEKR